MTDLHCGDQFGHWRKGKRITLCIVDGLGHGEDAEKAARAAIEYVAYHLSAPLQEIFSGCNRHIRNTRGVAMGIAVIDEDERTLSYAGVGNTRIKIMRKPSSNPAERETVHLVSDYGIVGGGYRKLSPETLPFGPGDLVFLHTDGVKELTELSGYREALLSDVQRLAEQIIVDWGCDTDDAAVLIFSNRV
jgi:serine phosphatase RsbU (regulator of sigma subunit)